MVQKELSEMKLEGSGGRNESGRIPFVWAKYTKHFSDPHQARKRELLTVPESQWGETFISASAVPHCRK